MFNLLPVIVLVQRILNYYPNYPAHRLYFEEVETPYFSFVLGIRNGCVRHSRNDIKSFTK